MKIGRNSVDSRFILCYYSYRNAGRFDKFFIIIRSCHHNSGSKFHTANPPAENSFACSLYVLKLNGASETQVKN
jgi:hypothetical protein